MLSRAAQSWRNLVIAKHWDTYRSHQGGSSLDFANAVRSLAVLRWEQARAVWGEVPELYTRLNIEAGIKESTARVTGLLR